MFSGLRPNEQIELQWRDIDMKAGKAAVRRRFKQEVREVKNYDARVLELHSRALAVLRR
jgi:integrase